MLQCAKNIVLYSVELFTGEANENGEGIYETVNGILYAKDFAEAGEEITCMYGDMIEEVKFRMCGTGLFEIPEDIDIDELMKGRVF